MKIIYPHINLIREKEYAADLINLEEALIIPPDSVTTLPLRKGGIFEKRGIYLDSYYDWLIGVDDTHCLVLLQLKREVKND